MIDNYKHLGLRSQLAQTLKEKGIENNNILSAVKTIPRHLFINSAFEQHAYEDKPFPIDCDQTISQPYTVASQTQLLDVKEDHKVLEIGTGSGYQTAVLVYLGAIVYTIERFKKLHNKSKLTLAKLGYSPKISIYGDGNKGLLNFAPFDRIIVTAGANEIPQALIEQLNVGGKIVIPVGESDQVMYLITKDKDGNIKKEKHGLYKFVPLLKDTK